LTKYEEGQELMARQSVFSSKNPEEHEEQMVLLM
jgi:hypothetical protein